MLILATIAQVAHAQAETLQDGFNRIQIKGPKDATGQFSGLVYGPIESDDTLWRIASRYRKDERLSIYQVMLAIYELNPDAFDDGNMNHMKDGAVLKLPSQRYIARIDPALARQKADGDDQQWQSQGQKTSQPTNVKPPRTLASQADLKATRSDIEKRIDDLNAQQQARFDLMRQQVADSITNLQALLEENNKLYSRLDTVNTEIENLKARIGQDGEIQQQMDKVLAMQTEALDIARQAEAARQQQHDSSMDWGWLTSPLSLLIGSVTLTLLLLGGFAWWMIQRKTNEANAIRELSGGYPESELAQVPTAMDNLSDALAEELDADSPPAPELDDPLNADDLADIFDEPLDELEDEGLDDALEQEMKSFDGQQDEMLVPDAAAMDDDFLQGNKELEQSDLDSLFDEELDDFDDVIELADDDADEPGDMPANDKPEAGADDLEGQSDSDDAPEISIDELLDESVLVDTAGAHTQQDEDTAAEEVVDESLEQDDAVAEAPVTEEATEEQEAGAEIQIKESVEDLLAHEVLDEETLLNIDEEIASKGQKIDELTDALFAEFDQAELRAAAEEEQSASQADKQDQADLDDAASAAEPDATNASQEQSANAAANEDISNESEGEQALADNAASVQADSVEPQTDDTQAATLGPDAETDSEAVRSQDADADSSADPGAAASATENAAPDNSIGAEEGAVPTTAEQPDTLEQVTPPEAPETPEELDEANAAAQTLPVEEALPPEADAQSASKEAAGDNEDVTLQASASTAPEQSNEAQADPQVKSMADEQTDAHRQMDLEEAIAEATRQDDAGQPGEDNRHGAGNDDDTAEADTFDTLEDQLLSELDIEDALGEVLDKPTPPPADSLSDDELDKALEDFEQEMGADDDPQVDADDDDPLGTDAMLGDLPELGDWAFAQNDAHTQQDANDELDLDALEDSDFDEMLESLEQPDNTAIPDLNSELDFDSLLAEDDPKTAAPPVEDKEESDDFIDVDTLLNESLEAEDKHEGEPALSLDTGLKDVAPRTEAMDVDAGTGMAAKLDLARAYLEIDDREAADELLEEVIEQGSPQEQREAQAIRNSLAG